jgi:hypothetical protein
MPASALRHRTQRGSALLIVFVFAAILAITLYKEMPVAAFEAQRQKEALLVSRGNEYKRAVKLFVRKMGRFPSSIEELEDTNRMRFLRHRYDDPLTGKDDWRMIHAGPGGVITDSQVATSTKPAVGALGQGAAFAGFNNSFTGDAAATADAGLRTRAPATKNAGDPNDPNSPALLSASDLGTESPAQSAPGALPGVNTQPTIDTATGQVAANPNGVPPPTQGGNGIGTLAQQLNTVNPQAAELAPNSQNPVIGNNTPAFGSTPTPAQGIGNGQLNGAGGIAGVASKAPGKSIKTVNDQTKYAKWEFYYDMQKDQSGAAANALQNMGTNSSNPNSNSALGQAQTQIQSSFGQSSFGQSTSPSGIATPAPATQPPPQ